MTQADVYAFMKKNKRRWFTAKEIGEKMPLCCTRNTSNSLRRLRRWGDVTTKVFLIENSHGRHQCYKYKWKK